MPPVRIHQIYFRPEQKQFLSPLFIPYFKPENEEREWREYWTFTKNAAKAIRANGYTGYISWKFEQKSKIPAEKFIRFIRDNPGYDVYFLNPFPLDALLFDSVWRHGDFYHPGLSPFTQQLLENAGYNINILDQKNTPDEAAFSNYWVGNARFWKTYMAFTTPLEKYIRTRLTPEESEYIYSVADPVSQCGHLPFIFERMFTTLLRQKPGIRWLAYRYDKSDLKNRYSAFARLAHELQAHTILRIPTSIALKSLLLLGRKL